MGVQREINGTDGSGDERRKGEKEEGREETGVGGGGLGEGRKIRKGE